MITEFYKNFVNNVSLTEEKIIDLTLTELGSGLYAYMYMLDNTNRKAEAQLIKTSRDIIFDTRDGFKQKNKLDISIALNKVYDLLTVQVTMLRANPERKWEAGFFQSNLNDLADFKYLMNPNKNK